MSEGNNSARAGGAENSGERLFNALADYLRLPLVSIARSAELGKQENAKQILSSIETSAASALRLIDDYLLAVKMNQGRLQLELEPIVLSSILYDSAHKLEKMAKAYNCVVKIDNPTRAQPILGHRASLLAALTSLGHVFIEAAAQQDTKDKAELTLATHNSKAGVVAGVFASLEGLSNQMFMQSKMLYGKARVPLHNLTSDSGVGVFVADTLFEAMSTRLRVAKHHNLNGLAATMLPSQQMSLV